METSHPNPEQAAALQPAKPLLRTTRGLPYEPAIGPRLKILLSIIFISVALLGATGVYLVTIRLLEWRRGLTYTNQFTLGMFMVHVVLGVLLVAPFLYFGLTHLVTARKRPNRVAVRLGISLFITSIVVGLTGLVLIQLEGFPQLPTGTVSRYVVYGLHLLAPVVAVVIYVLHRRAGPAIHWNWGAAWGLGAGAFVAVMCVMHSFDPRQWYAKGPAEGEQYFEPAKTRTTTGNFIPEEGLMMDSYCLKCHQDIYNSWFHSAHHFSSFNNPPYLFSVRETREVSLKRDGYMRASRWCAGCHDVVPFVSGKFDDKNFDDVHDPTAQAGLTCTVCHAITNINSPAGNGDYTIEEPQHYPFAYSKNRLLQWLNNQVVKAKPDFHKKTFLKPFHRTAEFCSVCHKVSLPVDLNHYKEFLRGQNHYDTYLLSGVSGVGSRSFYYPPRAKTRCAECHMPLRPSHDFGSRDFDGSGERKIHDHIFPAANTGLMALLAMDPGQADYADVFREAARIQSNFLRGTDPGGKDRVLRIDLFGLKEGGTIDGKLTALRPELPALKPGGTYLVEVVVRTLTMGHVFPQGTADSNEIWVDFLAKSGDRIIGHSGALSGPGDSGKVDEWSHFINVLMLDRDGNRINRRNPQDIFTPLYDHQIPPGAGQVVHYRLQVPADVKAPIELKARVRYRKFDYEYLSLVYKDKGPVPVLPITDMCEDQVILPVAGVAARVPAQSSPIQPAWQRWNDYGIGCFLEGGAGIKKGELLQAENAFRRLIALPDKEPQAHGYLNLARVYYDEGRLAEAVDALNKAQEAGAPWWTVAWFNGLVNAQNGHLEAAMADFEQILDPGNQPRERAFDFTRDYVVINELAATLFRRAQQKQPGSPEEKDLLRQAIRRYESTLAIEPEDLDGHYGLAQCFARLGEVPAPSKPAPADEAIEAQRLSLLAGEFTDAGTPRDKRLQAAAELSAAIIAYGRQPLQAEKPKLPALRGLIGQCRPLFDQAQEPAIAAAAAKVLGDLYRQAHAIYRPDDNAKDRAVRIYREHHRAAAEASQAIVIYPLHGTAAPGVALR
jgi:tetratricopeptide (TPR) repeat protein